MEKKLNKSKIILISIAIFVAILTLSIGIYGIREKNIKQTDTEAATDYYLITHNQVNHSGIDIYTNAEQYASGTKAGDWDIGGWYELSGAEVIKFEVSNDEGLAKYNTYIQKGEVPIDCRHIKIRGWFGDIFADDIDENTTYNIDISSTAYLTINGSITVNYGNTNYTLHKSRDSNPIYKYNNVEILSIYYNTVTINNEQGLRLYSYLVNEGTVRYLDVNIAGYTVDLAANLNMGGYSMPVIGSIGNHFSGKFYGNGHTISNLNMTDSNATFNDYTAPAYGLFGYTTGATINNLYLKNIKVTASSDHIYGYKAGGMIGVAKDTKISNCIIEGTIQEMVSTRPAEGHRLGGLVGAAENSVVIENCITNIKFEIVTNYTSLSIGGMVGGVWNVSCTLEVYNSCCNISVDRAQYIPPEFAEYGNAGANEIEFGGVVGDMLPDAILKVKRCLVQIYKYNKYTGLEGLDAVHKTYTISNNLDECEGNRHYIADDVGIDITINGSSDYGKPIN